MPLAQIYYCTKDFYKERITETRELNKRKKELKNEPVKDKLISKDKFMNQDNNGNINDIKASAVNIK